MNTARVADSYGPNPHEHKPSQDPFDPETAEEKQADTGEDAWPGNSSSTSPTSSDNSETKNETSDGKPAPSAGNRTGRGRAGNSSARSTATNTEK